MKKLLLLIAVYVFFSFPASAGCTHCGTNVCGGPYSGNCQCTDPVCDMKNECLSGEKCCEVFGNVGESRFIPEIPTGSSTTYYQADSYDTNSYTRKLTYK